MSTFVIRISTNNESQLLSSGTSAEALDQAVLGYCSLLCPTLPFLHSRDPTCTAKSVTESLDCIILMQLAQSHVNYSVNITKR